jgi:hypothetical protein
VQFANAPNAAARLSVWHPYLRAPGNVLARRIAAGRRSESFTVSLRSPPVPMSHDY